MRNKKVDNKNVYGITENTNIHLMKNSEWGAVAAYYDNGHSNLEAV